MDGKSTQIFEVLGLWHLSPGKIGGDFLMLKCRSIWMAGIHRCSKYFGRGTCLVVKSAETSGCLNAIGMDCKNTQIFEVFGLWHLSPGKIGADFWMLKCRSV